MFLIRTFLCVGVYLALGFTLAIAEEPLTLKLWPDGPPSKMNPKSGWKAMQIIIPRSFQEGRSNGLR